MSKNPTAEQIETRAQEIDPFAFEIAYPDHLNDRFGGYWRSRETRRENARAAASAELEMAAKAAPPDIIEQIARIFAVSTEHQDFRPGEEVWRGPSVHREYLRRAKETYELAASGPLEWGRALQKIASMDGGPPFHPREISMRKIARDALRSTLQDITS